MCAPSGGRRFFTEFDILRPRRSIRYLNGNKVNFDSLALGSGRPRKEKTSPTRIVIDIFQADASAHRGSPSV